MPGADSGAGVHVLSVVDEGSEEEEQDDMAHSAADFSVGKISLTAVDGREEEEEDEEDEETRVAKPRVNDAAPGAPTLLPMLMEAGDRKQRGGIRTETPWGQVRQGGGFEEGLDDQKEEG